MDAVLAQSLSMLLSWTAVVFALAGVVKGVVGLGLPTVSMALLALTMEPSKAAALLIVPSLVTNAWQMRPWSTLGAISRRLASMQVGVVAGTIATAAMFGVASGHGASLLLGAALIAYVAWGLAARKARIGRAAERWLGPLAGAATGAVSAVTGVFVVPAVPYLQSLDLDRDSVVRAMGLSFTVSTLALAAVVFGGPSGTAAIVPSMTMLVPALVGMRVGEALRRRLSPQMFRYVLLVALGLLGGYLVARGAG